MNLITNKAQALPERTIFTEWGRGYPVPYQNMSVRRGGYKLVGQTHYQAALDDFEMYDLANDPGEKNNLIGTERRRAKAMKEELDKWLTEMNAHPNNRRVHHIPLGTRAENPVVLNRNDAKGPAGIWTQSEIYGWWDVEVMEDGVYDLKFEFLDSLTTPGNMVLKLYPYQFTLPVKENISAAVEMKGIRLSKGTYRLEPHYAFQGKQWLPLSVIVEKR